MTKTIKIPDIAMWEETDSELAKYNIQQLTNDNKELLKTYDDLEEQYKSLMKQIIEQDKRIDKTIKYITSNEWAKDYKLSSCRTHLLDILRGEKDENNN